MSRRPPNGQWSLLVFAAFASACSTAPGLGSESCKDGQYEYAGRCVVPCPTLNGSLCELDGRPIELPAPPGSAPGSGGGNGSCTGGACENSWRDVALGLSHSCLLSSSGEVSCYGSNEFGQLGGSKGGNAIADLVAQRLSSGSDHTCALLQSGKVQCWGKNDKGQLGDSTEEQRAVPTAVMGLEDAAEISLAPDVSYVRARSGQVLYWGVSWGDSRFWVTTPAASGLQDAVSVAAGIATSCARIADGTVRCSGDKNGSAAGSSPSLPLLIGEEPVMDAKKIACAGAWACVALRANGRLISWGFQRNGVTGRGVFDDEKLLPDDIGLENVVDIAVGFEHACALGSAGEVWCWGRDRRGEMGGQGDQASPLLLATLPEAKRLWSSPAAQSTCLETTDGKLQCWGNAVAEQLGQGPLRLVKVPGGETL